MSVFSNWDIYNVIAEHVIEALQADSVLGSGGGDEIATWDAETRETAAEYNDFELPAIAVEVIHSGQEINPLSLHTTAVYGATMWITTGGDATLETVKQTAKRIGARVERTMRQQNRPAKQISDLPTDLEGAATDGVKVTNLQFDVDGGVINNVTRGIGRVICEITIDFKPTID